jgi:type I restriction enzyme, S subunit
MSELSAGWCAAKLGDLGDWSSGGTPSRQVSTYFGGTIPWVKTGDLRHQIIDRVEEAITEAGLAHSAAKLFPPGTLLVAMYGATIGQTGVLSFEAATNQACAALLAKGSTAEIIPYVWRYLIAEQEDLKAIGQGGAQPNISQTILKEYPIRVAPLPEQRRIVAKIDSLCTKSKRGRDHLDHIPRLVDKYKQAILAAAFRGDLTQVWRTKQTDIETAGDLIEKTDEPSQSRGGREATTDVRPGIAGLSVNDPGIVPPPGWAWVRLRRIARQETGHTPSRAHPEYWDGGIPWIGIRDAGNHHGRVIQQTMQTVSDQGLANSSARLLPAGTVCLSRTASVGYVTIMGHPMATSQDFATWTCTSALVPKYLMFALMAEGENIRKFGEGSTHTTIYFPEIRALHICLAPLAEQQEIVAKVEKALAWIDRLASEAISARRLIDHLDQAVLAKAFQGELVSQDPSDELASLLLERIRAEREATPTLRRRNAEEKTSEMAIKPKRRG